MLNQLKYNTLTALLGELCVKSGQCSKCYAKFESDCKSKPLARYLCPHGYIYDQAMNVWGLTDAVNPIERE